MVFVQSIQFPNTLRDFIVFKISSVVNFVVFYAISFKNSKHKTEI